MADAAPSALYRTRFTLVLRVLGALAGLVAAISMGISHETVDLPDLHDSTKIQGKDVTCFMYFVGFNVIVATYSFMVLFLPKTSLLWRSIVTSDMIAAMLLISINSATLGMFYMEMKGNSHANWSPICDVAPYYCRQVMVAVVAGFIALGTYFLNIMFCQCISLNPLLLQAPKKESPPPPQPKAQA